MPSPEGMELAYKDGMKTILATGILVISAGVAAAGYIVELEGGEQMTVDRYWEEGDRLHLMSGGVDMSVPKSRLRGVRGTTEPPTAGTRPASAYPAPPPAASGAPRASRDELVTRQRGIDRHLLRVQRERFEAEARGDPPRRLKRLGTEFRRTQERRADMLRQIKRLEPTD